jgi:Fe-S cluster assembly iron-binding protein IscA
MALDEPKGNDIIIENEGITFLVEKSLEKYMPEVNIDFRNNWMGSGFLIQSDSNTGKCSGDCC